MSIQDWGALGEIIGAVAVVVTLLYLAAQIRQNTRSLRHAASATVNDTLLKLNGRWVEDPNDFADVWIRGCANLDSLGPSERERWEHHALDVLNLVMYVVQLERDEMAEVHIDYVGYVRMLIHSNPGLKQFMRNLERGWSAPRDIFDRLMEEPAVKFRPGPGLVNEPAAYQGEPSATARQEAME